MLEKYKELDQRIKVIYREENGHISEATNSALSIATGDFVGFMDNDDELAPQALYEVVKALNTDPTIDFLYTDEDKITENGRRLDVYKRQLLVPKGFAHGFVTLTPNVNFMYKCDNYYNAAADGGIAFNDPALALSLIHI